MSDQPEALRLADALDECKYVNVYRCKHAATELRRLHAENEALLEACNNTFSCRCSKHFALQQPEQRPKRVLTAVWRDRAQRAETQRDALLEALKMMRDKYGEYACRACDRADAAIKAVEGEAA